MNYSIRDYILTKILRTENQSFDNRNHSQISEIIDQNQYQHSPSSLIHLHLVAIVDAYRPEVYSHNM